MSSSLIDAVRPHPTANLAVPARPGVEQQQDLLAGSGGGSGPAAPSWGTVPAGQSAGGGGVRGAGRRTTFAAIADWAADLDEAARARLGLPGRIPVGGTVWRFLIRIDAQVLQAQLGSLAGTIIVADALHTQVGHARAVAARGGQLMVTVKAKPARWCGVTVVLEPDAVVVSLRLADGSDRTLA
jgi:hypothetical protein